MSGRLTRLLGALAAALALAAAGLLLDAAVSRIGTARSRIASREEAIALLCRARPPVAELTASRDAARADAAALRSRFYRAGEISPYAFGAAVKALLAGSGLSVERYEVAPIGGRTMAKFSASGAIADVLRFLRGVEDQGKLWSIDSLSIDLRPGSGIADLTVRIGYEIDDGADR